MIRDYFEWLCDIVDPKRIFGERLLWELFSIPFESVLVRDENRSAEAIQLRYIYCDVRNDELERNDFCSILELFISLAIQLERETDAPGFEHPVVDFFCMMMNNLGLNSSSTTDRIHDAIYVFQHREYNYDGSGGNIIVLQNPPSNLKTTELWLQLTWYVNEIT